MNTPSSTMPTAFKQVRWHLLYYVLATFNIATILLSVFLTQQVLSIYRTSVTENQAWAERASRIAEIVDLSVAANAPGNDAFESGDIPLESKRLKQAMQNYEKRYLLATEDIQNNVPSQIGAPLLVMLSGFNTEIRQMQTETVDIFQLLGQGDREEAGEFMAQMDRSLVRAMSQNTKLREAIRNIQNTRFAHHTGRAAGLAQLSFGIIVLVIATIFGAVYFGALSRRSVLAEQEQTAAGHRVTQQQNESLRQYSAQLETIKTELATANAQLAGVLDAATQVSIIATDVHGLITVFNSGAENLLGYSAGEMVGKQTLQIIHLRDEVLAHGAELSRELDYLVEGFEAFVAYAKQGRFDQREWTFVRKDGSQFAVSQVITAVKNTAGEITGFLGVAEDISLRKRQEERFRIVVEAAPSAMVMIDRERRITLVNGRTEELFGYSRKELIGELVEILVPERFRPQHPSKVESFYRNPQTRAMGSGGGLFGVSKDGTEVPIELGLNPISTNEGTFVLASIIDITERKRTEEELRRAKVEAEEVSRILDSSLKSIADGVIVADSAGKFLFWNEVAEQIVGLGTTDTPIEGWTTHYGCFLPDMVTPFPPQDLPLARTIRGEDVYEDELFIRNSRKPDGVWLSVNGRPLRDETNQLRGGVIVFRDTTERRRHEVELHRAKEAAETANKAKSSFLANMSHEIRTPMNGIIGMTQLLARTELRSHQRDYLTTVDESAHILLRLLNDILDFSKIEAGKLELERVNFRISECVGRASQMLMLRAAEKGLEIVCRIAPEIPDHLLGDSGRIQQVLVNLLGNAVKFTEAGEIFVNLNVESITAERARLHFSVSDTGIGIPADKLVQIFRPFEQAESSTTRRFGGTGLGLAISRQLVEMMHGKIWVESEPGRGSTFHFTAELEISDDQHRHEPAELESLLDLPVLVVDDNFTNRRILGEMLQYWHMRPVLADSAAVARHALQTADESQHPIRLILLDHHMPGEDGLHFAESLRDIRNQGQCPIIMISSGTSPIDAELGQKYGIGRFMTKPVIASELLNEVLRQFGRYTSVKPMQPPTLATSSPVHPRRVLLVEDNEINRRVALGLLLSRGHQVVVAVNGLEAVNTLAAEEFDVVLMDMQMPVMDGYEATAEIRKREHQTGGHIPIVAMTAEALKGDRERCLDSGMDDYVFKPITPAEMYRAVERFPTLCLPVDAGLREASESGTTSSADRDAAPLEPKARADNSAPDTLPAIDWNVAKERLGGGTDTLREFAELAKKETATQLAEILRSIKTREFKLLRRAAHTLKGSVSYFGAEPLVQAALALENHGRNESWDGCAELLSTLESELARFLIVLNAGPPEASDGT